METSLLLSQDSLPNRPASAAAFAKQFATASPLDRNGGVASENADHAGAIQEEHTEVVRVIGGVPGDAAAFSTVTVPDVPLKTPSPS